MAIVPLPQSVARTSPANTVAFTISISHDNVALVATLIQVTTGPWAVFVVIRHPTTPALDFVNTFPPNTASAQIAIPAGFPVATVNGRVQVAKGVEARVPA